MQKDFSPIKPEASAPVLAGPNWTEAKAARRFNNVLQVFTKGSNTALHSLLKIYSAAFTGVASYQLHQNSVKGMNMVWQTAENEYSAMCFGSGGSLGTFYHRHRVANVRHVIPILYAFNIFYWLWSTPASNQDSVGTDCIWEKHTNFPQGLIFCVSI